MTVLTCKHTTHIWFNNLSHLYRSAPLITGRPDRLQLYTDHITHMEKNINEMHFKNVINYLILYYIWPFIIFDPFILSSQEFCNVMHFIQECFLILWTRKKLISLHATRSVIYSALPLRSVLEKIVPLRKKDINYFYLLQTSFRNFLNRWNLQKL